MTPKKSRKASLPSRTIKAETPCGPCYITVTFADDQPFELFLRMKKNGCCQRASVEAVGKLASLALRSGADPGDIFKTLKGINCGRSAWHEGAMVMSCFDAVASAYQEAWALFEEGFGQLSFVDAPAAEDLLARPLEEPQAG